MFFNLSFGMKKSPIKAGNAILINHSINPEAIMGATSSSILSKNKATLNSLMPKSLKKLKVGNIDFAKNIKATPINCMNKLIFKPNTDNKIKNWALKIRYLTTDNPAKRLTNLTPIFRTGIT